MRMYLTSAEREMDSRGASTLVNTMMDYKDDIHHQIAYWQQSIKGQETYMTAEEKLGSKNIQDWYNLELKTRSYRAPDWKVSPDRTILLQRFRDDPNYHFKNLVEMVSRSLVFEILRADGIDARVMVTSDSDDVFGGADMIVTINDLKDPNKESYLAIDLAVSENSEYLDKKEQQTETICYEFDAIKKLKHKPIPRIVFAIPPRVMAGFLCEYMKSISTNSYIDKKEILPLFKRAASDSVRTLSKKVHERIDTIIH